MTGKNGSLMGLHIPQLLPAFRVPQLPASNKNAQMVSVRVSFCFQGAVNRVKKSLDFTLTVPSKDQDSSVVSEGELESSEKRLTCSL